MKTKKQANKFRMLIILFREALNLWLDMEERWKADGVAEQNNVKSSSGNFQKLKSTRRLNGDTCKLGIASWKEIIFDNDFLSNRYRSVRESSIAKLPANKGNACPKRKIEGEVKERPKNKKLQKVAVFWKRSGRRRQIKVIDSDSTSLSTAARKCTKNELRC
jgi:hypothetical protein